MSEFTSKDIDGDHLTVRKDDNPGTPGTEFWVGTRTRDGRNATGFWLARNAAKELRDWLSEQLGDSVVATHDGTFYTVRSEHAKTLRQWLGEVLAVIEPDPVATQPMPPTDSSVDLAFKTAIAEAKARLANAKHARQILSTAGLFGGGNPVKPADIIALADWLGKNEDGGYVGVLDDEEAKA